jgi:hypothetical protein
MMSAVLLLALITIIEAGAVADHLRAAQAGTPTGLTPSATIRLLLVVVICTAATIIPLRMARQRMEALEV